MTVRSNPTEAFLFGRRSRADDERRILEYLEAESAVSETSISLARKLGVDLQAARDVLEELADAGRLRRRMFPDIEWMYCRFPSLDER
jgi:predicted ArsR family transcriptional regulator